MNRGGLNIIEYKKSNFNLKDIFLKYDDIINEWYLFWLPSILLFYLIKSGLQSQLRRFWAQQRQAQSGIPFYNLQNGLETPPSRYFKEGIFSSTFWFERRTLIPHPVLKREKIVSKRNTSYLFFTFTLNQICFKTSL